jgi:hypothetical protein
MTNFPQPVNKDLEEAMDAFAYLLATSEFTSDVDWILGDPGMGAPQDIPFGYVSCLNEQVKWYTANGGQGGIASGPSGVDDWNMQVVITVAYAQHQYVKPTTANPSAGSAFSALGDLPYQEQPQWRAAQILVQKVKGALRSNIVVGGFVATTNVVESKPQLINLDGRLYRAMRLAVSTQQRRRRGT